MSDANTSKASFKDIDMKVALRIGSYAGMKCRDIHGNIISEIWTQYTDTENQQTQLLDVNTLRSLLQEHIRLNLESNKELTLEMEDPGKVAWWILDVTQKWEKEYQNRVKQQWDMSQTILTAMAEAMEEVRIAFDETRVGLSMAYMIQQINEAYESGSISKRNQLYSDKSDALIRVLFRNEHVGPMLQMIAGKILQKRLVCNKAGMYSARVQRNDVTQEQCNAIDKFVTAVIENDQMFEHCKALFEHLDQLQNLCMDHTKLDEVSEKGDLDADSADDDESCEVKNHKSNKSQK